MIPTTANEPIDLDKICLDLEKTMEEQRNKVNEHIESDFIPDLLTDGDRLRNQVWDDYFQRKKDRICSRCGDYSKYEIIETHFPTQRDLNEHYGFDFYTVEYKIKTTRILNKNSIEDGEWGNLCHKCKDHILGKSMHDLSSSKEDIEFEIHDLRQNERKRQLYQDDDIKKARAAFNKERRENQGQIRPSPSPSTTRDDNTIINQK